MRSIEVRDFEALADADLAIVVNPNNPDGRVVEREPLLDLAAKLRARGGLLVVDEAFMDVGPREEALAGDVGQGGIVVLRSFGKFFGLAGLRLGFAIASEAIAERLEAEFGPWAVAGPALEYGLRALADHAWQADMRRRLRSEAARLDALLARYRHRCRRRHAAVPLCRACRRRRAFRSLGEHGILVRNFADRRTALRFGLPGGEDGMARLEAAPLAAAGREQRGTRRRRDDLCLPAVEGRGNSRVDAGRAAGLAARRRHRQ